MHQPIAFKRAPSEPPFGRMPPPSDTPSTWSETEFDVPAPEVDLPSIEPPQAAAAEHRAPLRVLPPIAELESVQRAGRPLTALASYRNLAGAVASLDSPSVEQHALLIGASRRAIETSANCQQDDAARDTIATTVLPWFDTPAWHALRHRTVEHFAELIELQLRLEDEAAALATFERARNLPCLTSQTRRSLARAAARLNRRDPASAALYLDALEDSSGSTQDNVQMIHLLRQALVIDLVSPVDDSLEERCALNERLWRCRALTWCAAFRAIGEWRRGRIRDALEIRNAATDLETADVQVLSLLGCVSYAARRWREAGELFERSADLAQHRPDLEPFYLALARTNVLLAGQESEPDRDRFRQRLEDAATLIERMLPGDARAMDARWVLGTTLYLLNRDRAALEVLHDAPERFLLWRHAESELQASVRLGQTARFLERLACWQAADPDHRELVELLAAKVAIGRLDFDEARGRLAARPDRHAPDALADGDLVGARRCLELELAMSEASALADFPPQPAETEELSAGLRSWFARLECRWRLERGEMQSAESLLDLPCHWFAPDHELRRLDAARLALAGMNDDIAENVFEHLASVPAAQPLDRLAWALWLCGRNDHAQARDVLAPLAEELPACLELRLGLIEAEWSTGADPQRIAELWEPLAGAPSWTEMTLWTSAPCVALFRPWQRRLPVTVWSQAAQVSMHRIADMLHAASLMIQTRQVDHGLEVVALAEELLGDVRPVVNPQLGRILRQACLAEVEAGHFERACQLHRQASAYDGGDPSFAVQIAELTAQQEAIPPDEVMEVLRDWVAGFAGEPAEFEHTPVAVALERFLYIDEATPESPTELARRRAWTRSVLEVSPHWDWPIRNLARDAAREGRHADVVSQLTSLAEPAADDHFLVGYAHWQLQAFQAARDAFARSIDAGNDVPNARAWLGCAQAAVCFGTLGTDAGWLDDGLVEPILANLQWQHCEGSLQPQIRVWHAAVMVAARRALAALEALDFTPDDESLRGVCRVLRGVALMLADRTVEAIDLWDPGEEAIAAPALELALRWWILEQQVADNWRQQRGRARRDARQRGAANELVDLVAARRTLAAGNPAAARAALEQAGRRALAEPLPVVLCALRPMIAADHAFLQARLLMHDGQFQRASEQLAAAEPAQVAPLETRYWRGVCLLHSGQPESALQLLGPLAQSGHRDSLGQIALIHARSGDVKRSQEAVKQVLAVEDDHLFALLAGAEVCQKQGRLPEAREFYRRMTGKRARAASLTLPALAMAALARIELHEGHRDAAQQWLRQSLELRPEWIVAKRRLGLLLAAGDESALEEAETLLAQVTEQTGGDPSVDLARALVAARSQSAEATAEHLSRAMEREELQRFPAELRRTVAMWSADLQVRCRRFGAAATALEHLAADGHDEAVEDRLVRCQLLWAIDLLQSPELSPGILEQALAAADAVRARRADHTLATLLALLCRMLLKRDDESTRALSAQLESDGILDPRLRLAASIARQLLGRQTALAETDSAISLDALGPAARRGLELLEANRAKDVARLTAEAQTLVASSDPPPDDLPVSPDDVVWVGGLAMAADSRGANALELLHKWHAARRGSQRTRLLHSHLLALEAVKSLRRRDFTATRDSLAAAVDLAQPSPALDGA